MSLENPQFGDVFFHPRFGGTGCTVRVLKRGIRKGWGDSVWVLLTPEDGHKISRPRRIWSMAGWPGMWREEESDKLSKAIGDGV